MLRSLVTGATGFIGARLVERLVARGDQVACLVRASSRVEHLEGLGVELRVGSLDDPASLVEATQGAEVIYHLAGLTHGSRQADFDRVNAQGAKRLGEAAAAAETPPVLVLVSSLAAVGPSAPGVPHTESTRAAPVSKYGRSKALGEDVVTMLADRVPVSIVRPPVVFGPGDRDGVMLFRSLRNFPLHLVPQLKGLPLSLIHVDDLVEAMLLVAERGERVRSYKQHPEREKSDPVGLYFAADPEVSSYAEMGRMAAAAMDRKIWVLCRRKYPFLPLAIAGDLWGRFRDKAPLFGMDKLREASASGWVCDPSKLSDQLGWRPAKPLAQRYADTYAWYVKNGWIKG